MSSLKGQRQRWLPQRDLAARADSKNHRTLELEEPNDHGAIPSLVTDSQGAWTGWSNCLSLTFLSVKCRCGPF